MQIILPAIILYFLIGAIAVVTFTDPGAPDMMAATLFLWPVFAVAWILVLGVQISKEIVKGSKKIFMEVIDVLQEE